MSNYKLVLSSSENKVNVDNLININETENTYFSHEHIVSLLKNQLKKHFFKSDKEYQIKVLHCIGGNRTIVNDKKTMQIKFQAYLEIQSFVNVLSESEQKKYFYTLNSIYIEINEEEGVIYIIDGQQRLTQFLTMTLFVNLESIFAKNLDLSKEMQKLLSKDTVNNEGLISENKENFNFVVETFNKFDLEKTTLSEIKTFSDYELMINVYNNIINELKNEVNVQDYFNAIIKKRAKKDKKEHNYISKTYSISGIDLFLYRLDKYIKQYQKSSYLKYLKTSFELIVENLIATDLDYTHLVNSMYSTKIYIIEKSPFMTAGQCLTTINKPGAKMNNITDIMDLFGFNLKSNEKYFNQLNDYFLSILSKIDSSKVKESVMDSFAQIISSTYTATDTFVSKSVDSQINIAIVIKHKINSIKKECEEEKTNPIDMIYNMAIEFLRIMDNFIEIQNIYETEYPLISLVDYLESNKIHFRNSRTILEIYRLGIESGMKEKTAFTYCPLLFELKKESSKNKLNEIFCLTKDSEELLQKILLKENTFFVLEKTEVNTLKSKEANFFNITRILMDKNKCLNERIKTLNTSNEFKPFGVFSKTYNDLQSVIKSMKEGNYHSTKQNDIGILRSNLMGFEKVIRMTVNEHIFKNNNYGLDSVITEQKAINKIFERELDFAEALRNSNKNDKSKRDKILDKKIEKDHMYAQNGSTEGAQEIVFEKLQNSVVNQTLLTKEKNRVIGKLPLKERKSFYSSEDNSLYKVMFNIRNNAFNNVLIEDFEKTTNILHDELEKNLCALLVDILDNVPKDTEYKINDYFLI